VGLTLGREILSLHGFEFSLDNHPDGGAEFRIRF
jgi:signal transduction histidine kinase